MKNIDVNMRNRRHNCTKLRTFAYIRTRMAILISKI